MKKLVLIFGIVLSQSAFAITFDQAFRAAGENSHDLKILRLQSESASWSETRARAGYLPKLQLDARHLFNERFQELEVDLGGSTVAMPAVQPYSILGVNATLNLFNGFRTTNELEAAHLERKSAESKYQFAREQTRTQIRTLFYRALGSQILVDVANQNIKSLESHLSDVNARIRSGVSTRYDSLRIDVQLEDARTEKIAAEDNVVIARAKLFETIGIADDGKPLEGKLPDDFAKIDISKLSLEPQTRIDRNSLIAERDRQLNLAKASRSHWMPSVSLFGNYEWYNNINHSLTESDERFKSAYAMGVKLNWDLFDGGAQYASQRQAAIANQVASENLAKFDEHMPIAFEEVKRRFSYDIVTYNAKLGSIRKAEEAVRLARGGVRAGSRTNTEVLDAVVDLNRARAAAVKSQVDAIEALGQLELAVGHKI